MVSTGGVPVDMGGGKIALVRDLNNLVLELIERAARQLLYFKPEATYRSERRTL